MFNQRFHIEQTRIEAEVPGLAADFDGFRIVHLTDLHHGRRVPISLIRRAVEAANDLSPDLVALTGDYVTGNAGFAGACVEALKRLRVWQAADGRPAEPTIVAVLGNHDHWVGAEAVAQALDEGGVCLLVNDHVVLTRGGSRLAIVGVDDLWTGPADLAAALAGLTHGVPRILLTHNPDVVEETDVPGFGLALAGHTHGGQFGLPLLRALTVPSRYGSKYAAGLARGPTMPVYVNRGVGTVGLPVRIRCRPEVALVVLRAAPNPRKVMQ